MGPELADAVARWQAALAQLEAAIGRSRNANLRRSDIELELGVMQDDRARLATELESASSRLARVETTTAHVGQRVSLAITSIREVLERQGAGVSGPG